MMTWSFDWTYSERKRVSEEGVLYRQQRLAELAKVTAIRDRMVNELQEKGVGTKYLAEMKLVDIEKAVNKR